MVRTKKNITKKKLPPKNQIKIPGDKLEKFIDNCIKNMKNKQDVMLRSYNFGKKNNQFIFFPDHKKFYMFNKEKGKVFFEVQFQIIGTFSPKSKTWRFAWANRYVPNELKRTSLKLKEFGESNNLSVFSEPKVKDEKLGALFTAIGMKLSNAKGYYIVPSDDKFPEVHLIFTKIKKINKSLDKIKNDLQKKKPNKKKKISKND